MKSIRCVDITKSFGGVLSLSNVSLDLHCGEVTAIIGPNGAGKTTLFNIVTGFLKPDSGRCFLGKTEITCMRPEQIANLGVVRTFQELRLIRAVSVQENLMLACPRQSGERVRGLLAWRHVLAEERENARESFRVLELLDLTGKMKETAGNLSYGEQKLLSLGCCLMSQAKFLLLDEPLAGVHPDLGERIVRMLRLLVNEQRGIVFIEHDIQAVRISADRLIALSAGKVIGVGEPAEVLSRAEIVEAYLA